jgi:hypothetical protein
LGTAFDPGERRGIAGLAHDLSHCLEREAASGSYDSIPHSVQTHPGIVSLRATSNLAPAG